MSINQPATREGKWRVCNRITSLWVFNCHLSLAWVFVTNVKCCCHSSFRLWFVAHLHIVGVFQLCGKSEAVEKMINIPNDSLSMVCLVTWRELNFEKLLDLSLENKISKNKSNNKTYK